MPLVIALSIIFEVFLLTISFLAYRKGMKKKFDVLTEFPYELMDKNSNYALITRLTFLLIFVAPAPWIFYQVEAGQISETLSAMTWFVFASFYAFIILFVIISLTNPAFELAHNMLFVGACGFLTIASGLEGTYIIRISSSVGNESTSIWLIVMAVLCFLIGLSSLGLLINPKLKNWPKLDTISEPDGTVSFKRPRPFVLAFSEWLVLFLAFIFTLVASASLIISVFA